MPAVVREQEREVAAEGHADEAAHGRDYDGALQVEPVGGTDPRGELVAEREKLAQHRARGERLVRRLEQLRGLEAPPGDRKSTRLNSSHGYISYSGFCFEKKKNKMLTPR